MFPLPPVPLCPGFLNEPLAGPGNFRSTPASITHPCCVSRTALALRNCCTSPAPASIASRVFSPRLLSLHAQLLIARERTLGHPVAAACRWMKRTDNGWPPSTVDQLLLQCLFSTLRSPSYPSRPALARNTASHAASVAQPCLVWTICPLFPSSISSLASMPLHISPAACIAGYNAQASLPHTIP